MLDRKAILEANDITSEKLSIPEWGGDVYIRVMTGQSRDAWEEALSNSDSLFDNVRSRMAVASVCDEEGNLLFTSDDVVALGKKSGVALDKVFETARRINKLSAEDIDALEKK